MIKFLDKLPVPEVDGIPDFLNRIFERCNIGAHHHTLSSVHHLEELKSQLEKIDFSDPSQKDRVNETITSLTQSLAKVFQCFNIETARDIQPRKYEKEYGVKRFKTGEAMLADCANVMGSLLDDSKDIDLKSDHMETINSQMSEIAKGSYEIFSFKSPVTLEKRKIEFPATYAPVKALNIFWKAMFPNETNILPIDKIINQTRDCLKDGTPPSKELLIEIDKLKERLNNVPI